MANEGGRPTLGELLLGFTVGLVLVVVLAYWRIEDVQVAVHAAALELEERFFGGDVAGATAGGGE